MKLTVLYDGQFWIGITEYEEKSKLKAARNVFGSEPKDAEILEFVQSNLLDLLDRGSVSSVSALDKKERRINPKRIIRNARKEMNSRGVSTKAAQAIQQDLEKRKKEKKVLSKERKEEIAAYKREVARRKAKAKHRGH
ncbi:YjdF family protein [Brevibacillus laterosporus]|uniref:YjdF family protein n=1 Tax=Brevibacillus laterosporus TaxID=1465 RepID=UPI002655647D|nr:YjdF family protein [Brevibacillus laterosporus]MDN9010391.1 YjdF family protein [Brevibacillus laterosporus]MDO0941278.1 YjdF family protein [Brevibacillus laterosporus]